jgi:biopolymer transport protein ExbB/TolQ
MGYLGPHIGNETDVSEHVVVKLKKDFDSGKSSSSAIQREFINALLPEASEEAYSDTLSGLYSVLLSNQLANDGIEGVLKYLLSESGDAVVGEPSDVSGYFKRALVPRGTWFGKRDDPRPEEILKGLRTMPDENKVIQAVKKKVFEDEEDPQLREQKATIFEAYLKKIQGELGNYGRLLQLLMGPVQYVLFLLYFTGLILTAQRFWFAQDPGGFEAWARRVVQGADTSANQGTEHLADRVEKVEYAPIDYIAWSLPTIGFIGTVIGISLALDDADRVALAKGALEQGSAIDAVTSLLGVAFDTTLIALIASALILLLVSVVQTKEASIMLDLETTGQTN